MMNHVERWQQRYQSFTHAYEAFCRVLEENNKHSNEITEMALIQAFECTFELAWKLLKDYLKSQGTIVNSLGETIKYALQKEMIQDGTLWLAALDARNKTTHTYDATIRQDTVTFITQQFFPLVRDLHLYFKEASPWP